MMLKINAKIYIECINRGIVILYTGINAIKVTLPFSYRHYYDYRLYIKLKVMVQLLFFQLHCFGFVLPYIKKVTKVTIKQSTLKYFVSSVKLTFLPTQCTLILVFLIQFFRFMKIKNRKY